MSHTFYSSVLCYAGRAIMADPNTVGRSMGVALQAARRRSVAVGSMAVSESLKEKQVSQLAVRLSELVTISPF